MSTHTHPVDRLLAEIVAGREFSTETWTADARLDATVPDWRFQRDGAEAVAAQMSAWYRTPATIDSSVRCAIPDGELVELDLAWVEDGIPHAAHQMHLLTLDGERISADTFFCGGRWPASLLAVMEASRGH